MSLKENLKEVWKVIPEKGKGFFIGFYYVVVIDLFSKLLFNLGILINNKFIDFIFAIIIVVFIVWFTINTIENNLNVKLFK